MIEQAGKVASGVVDALKTQPLSLALVVMNIALLALMYVIVGKNAEARHRESTALFEAHKQTQELLARGCQQQTVVPKTPD